MTDLLDNLNLQIEVPTTGLQNLVQNPSGDLGAWGWNTPVTNTLMEKTVDGLRFKTTVFQAAYWTSELMPLAAGEYVAGRFDAVLASAGYQVKARFVFYDTNRALLSSGAQTGYISGAAATNYVPAALSPASTAYVAIRFDLYANTSGTNPATNSSYTFKNAMVTHAPTSGGIASSRTNYITNPSFETNATGWGSFYGWSTVARTTSTAQTGAASLQVTCGGVVAQSVTTSSLLPIVGGATYTLSGYSKPASTLRTVRTYVEWYDKTSKFISASAQGTATETSTSTWTRVAKTAFVAPTNATQAKVYFSWSGAASSEVHYLDSVLLEQSAALDAYFDGSSVLAGKTYAWAGTAHASKSTETSTASYAFTEPVAWLDILGPTTSINFDKGALDVGLLNVSISDAYLDPAYSSTIAPGKKVRLLSLVGGVWENLYTGKVTNATVTYPRGSAGKVSTAITLTASDNIAALANQAESRTVATVAELPYILEGKSVPWNVNGSGNQVTSATVVALNDNASALDQVAITRDSELAYSWVDRYGVLQAWGKAFMPTAPAALFGDRPAETITIPNADMEAAGVGPWQVNASNTAVNSTDTAHTGTHSLKVTKTTAVTELLYVHNDSTRFAVNGGQFYRFSYWAKMAVSNLRWAALEWHAFDAAGTEIGTAVGKIVLLSNTTWTQSVTDIPVPDGAVSLAVYPRYAFPTPTASEVVYFDDFTMTNIAGIDSTIALSYSDIDAEFNTDDCINQVTVNWLHYNPADKSTEEVPYTGYKNQTSIDMYGPHTATFTIGGASEDTSIIGAYAQAVLDANSYPTTKTKSITVPVVSDQDRKLVTHLDLYSPVFIAYADKTANTLSITGIEHNISPGSWTVTYTFSAQGAVATPTVAPSPPSVGVLDGTWITPALTNSWVNFGGAFATVQYMRKNGIVYLKGAMKTGGIATSALTLPAGYRPAETRAFASVVVTFTTGAATAGTAHTHNLTNSAGRVDVQNNGWVIPQSGTNGFVSLDSISYPAEA